MREFDNFLGELDLIDVPLVGRYFTWFHPNGLSMSRLERILISPSWCVCWGDPFARVLDRDVADHCPIVLRYNLEEWGPKPFRFSNFWLRTPGWFKEVVFNGWASCVADGWMRFILKERLKHIKGVIKEWNLVNHGETDTRKKLLIKEILDMDLKSETMGLDELEVEGRKKLF
jgi:hypothetical protein